MSETLAIKNKDHFLAHFRNLDFSFDVDFSKTKREEAEKWVKKL